MYAGALPARCALNLGMIAENVKEEMRENTDE
jgi:hypothetical protein